MCSSVWKRFPSHLPRRNLSVIAPPGTFPAILNILAAPKQICRYSPCDTCLEDLLRFRRSKDTQVSGPRRDPPLCHERSKKITRVISSTDLIPCSKNPLDCESATGECSSSVPRDPRKCAISLNTSTMPAPDQISRLSDAGLPNQRLLLSLAPRELTPCDQRGLSIPGSLLIPTLAGLA